MIHTRTLCIISILLIISGHRGGCHRDHDSAQVLGSGALLKLTKTAASDAKALDNVNMMNKSDTSDDVRRQDFKKFVKLNGSMSLLATIMDDRIDDSTAIMDDRIDDSEAALKEIAENKWAGICIASDRLRGDRDFVLEAVKLIAEKKIAEGTILSIANDMQLWCASEELRDDSTVIMEAVQTDGKALCDASDRLKDDYDFVTEAVQKDGHAFSCASFRLREDRKLAREAMKNGGSFCDAAWTIREDPILALQAVRYSGSWLYCALELRRSFEFVMEAVKNPNPGSDQENILCQAFMVVRDDPTVVMEALRYDGLALCCASEELQGNRTIVMQAVQKPRSLRSMPRGHYGQKNPLECASKLIKDDWEVVEEAWKHGGAGQAVDADGYLKNLDLALIVVRLNYTVLCNASEHYRNESKLVRVAIEAQSGVALRCASKRLQDDDEMVMQAVKRPGNGSEGENPLCFASARLQDDPTVVMKAVRHDGTALYCASNNAKANRKVVMWAVRKPRNNTRNPLFFASEELRGDREVVMEAVKHSGGDYHVVMEAVKNNICALSYASGEIRGNHEVVMAAVRQKGSAALAYASKELQGNRELTMEAKKVDDAKPNLKCPESQDGSSGLRLTWSCMWWLALLCTGLGA